MHHASRLAPGGIVARSRRTSASALRKVESLPARRERWNRFLPVGLSREDRSTGHHRIGTADPKQRDAAWDRPVGQSGTRTVASSVSRGRLLLADQTSSNRQLERGFGPVIWQIGVDSTGEAHPCPKRIVPCFNSTIYLLMSSCMIELGTITSPRQNNGGSAFCPAGPTQFLHFSLDTVDFTHPVGQATPPVDDI